MVKPAPLRCWETVADLLDRIEVPGGWLYRTTNAAETQAAVVFVPHPPPPEVGPVASEEPL